MTMLALHHAFVHRHREEVAVLVSSVVFLASALPLFWALG
ncbi:hypothetical protein ABIE45_001031 [Methylobacterium sp. OAE515]|jgi:hypothetical protein